MSHKIMLKTYESVCIEGRVIYTEKFVGNLRGGFWK